MDRLNGFLIITLVLLFALSCETDKKEQLNIVIPPTIIASLPHWVALEQGYYDEEGFEINEYGLNDSRIMITALQNNDADFLPAVSLVDAVNNDLIGSEDGAFILSHSRMKLEPAFESIIVRNDSSVISVIGLENKKIAVYPGITSEAALKYYLQKLGIQQVEILKLPPPEHIRLLKTGEIDASYCYEPTRTQLLENDNFRSLTNSIYASFNEPSAIGITMISNKLFNDKVKLQKLINVWNKSIDFIRSEPIKARLILAKKLKLNEDIANKATWVDATKTNENSRYSLVETIKSFNKMGLTSYNIQKQINLIEN